MIEEKFILSKIQQLPEKLKAEVLDFIEFLKMRHPSVTQDQPIIKGRAAGSAKGKFVMAPDFDEPLDDFEDYR